MKLNKDKIHKHKYTKKDMKKGLVLFTLLISIISVMSFVSAACSDSDNGINYYSKGSAKEGNQTITDECVAENPKQLSEAYCENGIAKSAKYDCPDGCSNGACLCPTTKCSDGTTYGPEKCRVENNVCVCPSCPPIPINKTQCYSNADCPSVSGEQYCKNEKELCGIVSTYSCSNGQCIGGGGGLGCKVCPDICKDGSCITSTQCSSNADCPSVNGKQYCDGNNACTSTSIYSCVGGKCVASGGGGGCITCPSGCYNGVCIIGEEIKEQVKCVFEGSTQLQKCYTAEQNSRAYCSGVETCIADISGYKGEKITWKSTCGGYDYTIIDGENEYAKFSCGGNVGICQPSKCDDGTVTECKIDNGQCICSTCPPIIIKPVCGNGICEPGEGEICSATAMLCEVGKECKAPPSECFVVCPQDCKITEPLYPNLNEKFKLQVYQSAKIVENGNHVMKITFKDLILSQCGEIEVSSKATETIESKVAIATGMAIAPTETTAETSTTSGGGGGVAVVPPSSGGGGGGTTSIIKCNANAVPTASLGIDMIINSEISMGTINIGEKKQVGEFTVSFLGYDYASRTGTFLVTRETFSCPEKCKCDENGKIIECAVDCKEGETLCPDGVCREKCEIITEDCKYGCNYDGKCFPMGVRSSGMYCGTELFMSSQKASDETCDNNFECSSNVCVSGNCVSEGLIQKILSWFKRIFG